MKKDKLDCIGYIDSQLIEKAEDYKVRKKKNIMASWGAVAACLCIVLAATAIVFLSKYFPVSFTGRIRATDGDPIEYEPNDEYKENEPSYDEPSEETPGDDKQREPQDTPNETEEKQDDNPDENQKDEQDSDKNDSTEDDQIDEPEVEYYLPTFSSLDDYYAYIERNEYAKDIVLYDDIKSLGNFKLFVVLAPDDFSEYNYKFDDGNSIVSLSIELSEKKDPVTIYHQETITEDDINPADMRCLTNGKSGEFWYNGIGYVYITSKLVYIEWVNGRNNISLSGLSAIYDYPQVDSFVSKFFDLKTVEDAIKQISGNQNGEN